jgi:hypothetical protein
MSLRATESRLATAAARHLKPEHIGSALDSFAQHLSTLPPDELSAAGAIPDAHADAHFAKIAAEHPDRARRTKQPPKTW